MINVRAHSCSTYVRSRTRACTCTCTVRCVHRSPRPLPMSSRQPSPLLAAFSLPPTAALCHPLSARAQCCLRPAAALGVGPRVNWVLAREERGREKVHPLASRLAWEWMLQLVQHGVLYSTAPPQTCAAHLTLGCRATVPTQACAWRRTPDAPGMPAPRCTDGGMHTVLCWHKCTAGTACATHAAAATVQLCSTATLSTLPARQARAKFKSQGRSLPSDTVLPGLPSLHLLTPD